MIKIYALATGAEVDSIAFAGEFATGVARSAMTSMDTAFAGLDDSPALRFIAHLVPFMIERAS